MRILVTGGGGFIGGYIVNRLLARGFFVRVIGRTSQPKLTAKGVEFIPCDLMDTEAVCAACVGIDTVFHVAAKAGVWGSWDSFYQPNVVGSKSVLEACRRNNISRLVYTSTPSVVFNRRSIKGQDESMPYGRDWLCHYAHTKAIAEADFLAANCESLRVVALRPHLVFGPGDPHLLPRVIDSARAGRLKIVGDGENTVDVSYVGNVADAHLAAMDALENGHCAGKAYFISQDEPVKLWQWINRILEGLGHSPIEQKIPLPVAYTAGAVCEAFWKCCRRVGEPPMTRFIAVELAKDHYYDIAAAKKDFNYRPTVGMNQAVSKTIEDLKDRGYSANSL